MVKRKSRNEIKLETMTNKNDVEEEESDEEYDIKEGFVNDINNNAPGLSSFAAKQAKIAKNTAKDFNKSWKSSNPIGKIMMILKVLLGTLSKIMEDFAVFFIAAISVMYLYFKFEMKKSEILFPSDPTKFPYVFFDDKRGMENQNNMTSSIIDENAGFDENFYTSVDGKYKSNGSIDIEATKDSLNQPTDATRNNMSKIGEFFNYTSKDKKSMDINLIQLVSFALVSGVLGVQGFFGQLHDLFKSLYLTEDKVKNNYFLRGLGKLMSFFLFVFVFYLFKMSKHDLSNLIMPIIRTNSAEFSEGVFGIPQIINLFSSLFSGFFSFFKIIFVVSYIAFIFNVVISLFRINGSLTNFSSIFISYIMILTFLSNFIVFAKSFADAVKNAPEMNSIANQFFKEILNTVKGAINSFKNVSGGKGGTSFISKLFNVDKINMGSFTSMFMFILTLPITLMSIPFLIIPVAFIILGIVMTFIPFIGSIFTSLGITYDFTVNGLYNMVDMGKMIKSNYIMLILAYSLGIVFTINNVRKNGKGTLNAIETLAYILLVSLFIIVMFVLRPIINKALSIVQTGKKSEDKSENPNTLSQNNLPTNNETNKTPTSTNEIPSST